MTWKIPTNTNERVEALKAGSRLIVLMSGSKEIIFTGRVLENQVSPEHLDPAVKMSARDTKILITLCGGKEAFDVQGNVWTLKDVI